MAAPSAKMRTVEAFCSSQGSLEGIWLERAKQLVGEVPGEELDCTAADPIFVMFCLRGARFKAGRVQREDWLAQRAAGGTCCQQTHQRGIFSHQVSCLTNPYQLESQILAWEQLGRGHWCRSDSGLASNDPRLLSLHECRTSFSSGARLEQGLDLQSGDARR